MPSFPAANLGSPRPSGKADRLGQSARPLGGQQGKAERMRSCPLLGPQSSSDTPMAQVRCSSRGTTPDVQPRAGRERDELEGIARPVAPSMGSPPPWADVTGDDLFNERPATG